MIDRHTIPFLHWSIKIGRVDPKTGQRQEHFGEIVSSLEDLHQAIRILVLTQIGSVPLEPEKGCDTLPYIDKHESVAVPNLTRVIWDALAMWEPRILMHQVEVQQIAYAQYAVRIFWRPVQSVLDDILITDIELAPQNDNSQNRQVA